MVSTKWLAHSTARTRDDAGSGALQLPPVASAKGTSEILRIADSIR